METSHESGIGERIRELRKVKGISIRELSRQTGLTSSFLSQVERGLVSTSINSLRKIAEVLEVSILYFLNDRPEVDPVVRAGSRVGITMPGYSEIIYELITPSLAQKVEVFLGKLAPGKSYEARQLRAPTEECVYVLNGALRVILERTQYTLHPGDSITFEGIALKGFACDSEEEARWIAVITPPVF